MTLRSPSLDFEAIFESLPGLFVILSPDFQIVAVSNEYLRATMTCRSEVLGKNLFEVFPDNPDDSNATGARNLRLSLERVLRHRVGDAMAVQKYDIRKPESSGGDFEERFWSPFNSPVFGPDGSLTYIIHRAEDVTEFVREKQRVSERDLQNQALRDHVERIEAGIFNRTREVAEINTKLKEANEQVTQLYETTQRLERERAAELLTLLDIVPMPVMIANDPACRNIRGNRAANELVRVPRGGEVSMTASEESKPRHFRVFKDGKELIATELPVQRAARGIPVENFQFTLVFNDGTSHEILANAAPLWNYEGQPRGAIAVMVDITELKETQAALVDQKTRLRGILDSATDGIVTIDHHGIIQSVNPATERLFGYTAAELIGQNVKILMPVPYQDEHEIYLQNYQNTGRRKIIGIGREAMAKRKDGSMFHVDLAVSEVPQLKLYTGIIRDITQRKNLEGEVARMTQAANRSQRLESIGTLAGGIAHDLNNVLTPILIGADLMLSGRSPGEQQSILQTISMSARRGSELIRQLLSFAGGVRGNRSLVDLSRLILETRDLLTHTLPKSICINIEVPSSCSPLLGNATEVSQVILNLCINARDAMPEGGRLTIRVKQKRLEEHADSVHPEAHPGCYVILQVSDTGCGMSPEVLDRIFDPFYTTKEVGKGTGLGLATVQGIVKNHDGFILVQSEPGCGSTFDVYFPAITADECVPTEDDPAMSTVDVEEGATILLVDDESLILQITSSVLECSGYRVMTAHDGAGAVATLEKYGNQISAVLLDMMMPGMDGPQTLVKLKGLNPDIAVIACSGLSTLQRQAEIIQLGASAFLAKPYTEEELLQSLSQVLEKRKSLV
jgi:PAS domain S-box-containing protein